jgi:hypothetical protein
MCLTCGCMDAHQEMGEHNFTYEDLKAAADENGKSVAETLEIINRTAAKDKEGHAQEYAPASYERQELGPPGGNGVRGLDASV